MGNNYSVNSVLINSNLVTIQIRSLSCTKNTIIDCFCTIITVICMPALSPIISWFICISITKISIIFQKQNNRMASLIHYTKYTFIENLSLTYTWIFNSVMRKKNRLMHKFLAFCYNAITNQFFKKYVFLILLGIFSNYITSECYSL